MTWIRDHQVLLAGLLLVALVLVGLIVLAVSTLKLVRTAKRAKARVDAPVAEINAGLSRAQGRVDEISRDQEDLGRALERVGARTPELKLLLSHAGRALAVLRAPFRYLGK